MPKPTQAQKVGALHEIPASFPRGLSWYAIRTNIQCERRAQMGLDALGFRTYLPQCTRWVKHARTKTQVRRPLFARYLFVEFDINLEGTDGIRSTNGVESILGAAGVPITMPGVFVTELLRRELQGEFDYVAKDKLPHGAKIVILEGKYDGLIAVLCGINGNQVRCKELQKFDGERWVKFAGNPQELKLPIASVRAA